MAVDLFKFPDLATARRGDPHATLDGTLGGKAPSRKADLRSTVAKVDAVEVFTAAFTRSRTH